MCVSQVLHKMGWGHGVCVLGGELSPPLGVLTPISTAHQESINTSGRGQRLWHRAHLDTHVRMVSARTLPTHMVLSEEISIRSHAAQCASACVSLSVRVPIPVCSGLSWCEVGEQIGGQQGGQARVTPV